MGTTFKDLVFEIFQLIFQYLNTRDLSLLSKTNKAFRTLTLPFLYHTISFDGMDPVSQRCFQLFIRSILYQPDLAVHVKQLSLKNTLNMHRRFWTPSYQNKISAEGFERVQEAIQKVMMGLKLNLAQDAWVDACLNGSRDALTGFLICQLPSLQSLSLCRDLLGNSQFVSTILTTLIVPHCKSWTLFPGYSHLRSVEYSSEIQHTYDGDEFDISDTRAFWERIFARPTRGRSFELPEPAEDDSALALFYLPEIRTLRLSLTESSKAFRWPDLPPHATNLRTLSIKNSEAKEEVLAALLATTPNLESLRYDYHINTQPTHRPDLVVQCSGSKIADAIRQVSGSLKNLVINIRFFNRRRLNIEGGHCRVTSIGSLLHMTRLETLKINASLLFGWDNKISPDLSDILPANLRDLTMTMGTLIGYIDTHYPWTEEHMLKIFSSFLPRSNKHTPNLHRLVMARCFMSTDTMSWTIDEDSEYVAQPTTTSSNMEKLQKMCDSVGIVCANMNDFHELNELGI